DGLREVAHERELGVSMPLAVAGEDDLPVPLYRHRGGGVVASAAEMGPHLAARTEARVECAARGVADEGEVVVAVRRPAVAGDEDLPVRLHRYGSGRVIARGAEAGQHYPSRTEACVERAACR